MNTETLLFALLRAAVCGETITDEVKNACTEENLIQVCALAQKHDLAHLIGHAVGNLGLPESDILMKLKQLAIQAVYRYVKQDCEFERICQTLEQAQIPFIPLKGAVIRKLYPEPWMRTSCDIDILIHESDLEKAIDLLTSVLQYSTDHKKNYHDVSLFSKQGVHLELHFSIQETMENIDRLLSRVWDYAYPVTQYRFALQNEFLMFHLLAHMSYHFIGGGCGIRPFLDIFLLRKQKKYDEFILRGYLAQCGIEKFYDSVLDLINVWFQGGTSTALTGRMERYLLSGGTYGSQEQRIAVRQQRQGGRLGYLLSRVFMPYRVLKIRYRVLERYPILFPVMQVYRWIELLFGGRLNRSVKEAKIAWQTDDAQSKEANDFLRQIGL